MRIRTIIRSIQKLGCVFILWAIFSAGCVVAPVMAILLIWRWHDKYMRNFVLSADRLCASILGFSGRTALSAELVHSTRLLWIRDLLDIVEPGHCTEAAYTEGVYCRLSDHTLGGK